MSDCMGAQIIGLASFWRMSTCFGNMFQNNSLLKKTMGVISQNIESFFKRAKRYLPFSSLCETQVACSALPVEAASA